MTVFILKLIPQVTGSSSVALGPAVSASPGNLLVMHILRPCLNYTESNPRDLKSNLISQKHTKSAWLTLRSASPWSKAPSKDLNSANT